MNQIDLTAATPLYPSKPPVADAAHGHIPSAHAEPAHTAAVPVEILTETLLGYGYNATDENKAMLRLMLENGMPLTKENIARMNQALKLAGTPEKALFLLENNLKMTQANAAQLEALVSGQAKITAQLGNLLAAVEDMSDPVLKAQLKKIIAGNAVGAEAAAQNPPPATSPATARQSQTLILQTAQATQDVAASQGGALQNSQSGQATAQATQNPAQNVAAQAQPQTAPATQIPAPEVTQAPQNPAQGVAAQQPAQTAQTPPPVIPTAEAAAQVPQISAQAPAQAASQAAAPPQEFSAQTAQVPTNAQAPTNAQIPSQAPASAQIPSQAAPQIPAPIPANLLFPLEESTPETIDRYLHTLRETLSQVRQALAANDSSDAARVLTEARAVEGQIDFAAQLRNQVFVQLPLFHDGRQSLATLQVFRDAKNPRGSRGDLSSALIALDTAAMGHFETYVQKNSRAVHCQFRLESDEVVRAVRNNIHKLGELLRECGYSLESFSFLPPGEPYTVLDSPKTIGHAIEHIGEIPHFDERV